MDNSNESGGRKVRSLRELPEAIEPPAGLWLRIAGQIEEPRRRQRPPFLAAAAVLLALAAGLLAGYALRLPGSSTVAQQAHSLPAAAATPEALAVSFISDPRYLRQRSALLSGLEAHLAALPPDTREKVGKSLVGLQQSMRDLQAALGRDPSNELLQALLVDTCQDEMRVLVSVDEAGQESSQL
jgi:hypothetical protein